MCLSIRVEIIHISSRHVYNFHSYKDTFNPSENSPHRVKCRKIVIEFCIHKFYILKDLEEMLSIEERELNRSLTLSQFPQTFRMYKSFKNLEFTSAISYCDKPALKS